MPGAVVPILIGGGLGAVSAALAGGAILTGFLLGAGLAAISYLLAPSAPDIGALKSDTQRTLRVAVANARWILGRARVGGVLAFVHEEIADDPTSGRSVIHMAYLIAEGPCAGVEKVWADERQVSLTRGTGSNIHRLEGSAGSDDAGKIVIYEYFSASGTDGGELDTEVPEWNISNRRLNGISWLYVKLFQPAYSDIDDRYWKQLPNFNFLVKGLEFTWPGQTSPTWTENAAAIRWWWMTARRGIPQSAIDIPSVTAAIAACGAAVRNAPAGVDVPADYPEHNARYTINGTIESGDDASTIEQHMDFAWQGYAVEVGGVHYFRPGVSRAAAATIGADDILEPLEAAPTPSLQDRVNAIRMNLAQSALHDYTELAMPEIADAAAQARDGRNFPAELGKSGFIVHPAAAARLMHIALRRANLPLRMAYRIAPGDNFERMAIRPGDHVLVNDPTMNLANRRFEVARTAIRPDWSIELQLRAIEAGTYDTADLDLPPVPAQLEPDLVCESLWTGSQELSGAGTADLTTSKAVTGFKSLSFVMSGGAGAQNVRADVPSPYNGAGGGKLADLPAQDGYRRANVRPAPIGGGTLYDEQLVTASAQVSRRASATSLRVTRASAANLNGGRVRRSNSLVEILGCGQAVAAPPAPTPPPAPTRERLWSADLLPGRQAPLWKPVSYTGVLSNSRILYLAGNMNNVNRIQIRGNQLFGANLDSPTRRLSDQVIITVNVASLRSANLTFATVRAAQIQRRNPGHGTIPLTPEWSLPYWVYITITWGTNPTQLVVHPPNLTTVSALPGTNRRFYSGFALTHVYALP